MSLESNSKRRGWAAAVLTMGLVAIALLGTSPPARAGSTVTEPALAALAQPVSGIIAYPTPIQHVVVVMLENERASYVWAMGPYEVKLAETYAYANNSYGSCHPSLPNYIAITSGEPGRCGSDTFKILPGTGTNNYGNNIGDLMEARGFTWAGFFEDMPSPCDTSDAGEYDAGHNPFVHYGDIVRNATRCAQTNLNFNDWNHDVATGNVPNYAFVVPNLLNDGHDTDVAYADAWLSNWLPPLLKQPWAASTVFIITYDEGESNAGFCGPVGNVCVSGDKVYTVLVSPYTWHEGNYSANVTGYNLLTMVENLFAIHDCGNFDDPYYGFIPLAGAFEFFPADNDAEIP